MTTTVRRTARKPYECDWQRNATPCKPIQPGDVYYIATAFPGDEGHECGETPWRMKLCADCAAFSSDPSTVAAVSS